MAFDYLRDPELRRPPYLDLCAGVLAAAQLCRLSGTIQERTFGWHSGKAQRALESSGQWASIVGDVYYDKAEPHELQLVLESAQADKDMDAWRALVGFVDKRYGWRMNLRMPHLLAMGQTELMRDMGLFKDLDVRDPNPLVQPMTKRLRSFIRRAEQAGNPLAAKEYGEQKLLPDEVWWTARA